MEQHDSNETLGYLSGQLAVNIKSARDLLGVDSGGTSDPYVIARLETPHGKSDKMKTRVIQKNLNPEWHETFVFSTSDITQSTLYLQVWDWNVLRDEELGKATFELRSLTQHNACLEFNLPLHTSSVTPQGELIIELSFTPLPTITEMNHKPKGSKIPNFRLELTKQHYLPGEKVTGFLVYNATTEHKIRNIRLDFLGKEHVLWAISTGKVTVVYAQIINHAEKRVYMMGTEKGKMTCEAKFYRFPFEFDLPPDAPPTFHKKIGNISYVLKGTVDIPLKSDKTATSEIIVHRPVHDIIRSVPKTTEHHVNQDVQGLLVNVTIEKNTFTIGETVVLQFAVDNKSTHKIDEISVKLEQREEYHATTTKTTQKATLFSDKIDKNSLPIQPQSSWTYGYSLPIPIKDTNITLDGVAKIILVKHYIVVNFHYGTLKNVTLNIPVTLLEDLAPNALPPSTKTI